MSFSASTATKLGLLGTLYFSQGMPFGFFQQALPVLLRHEGVSLPAIGMTSLLALPWALKFLWAPLVDRYYSPRIGRRRSWILPMQAAAVVVLTGIAVAGDGLSVPALLAAVVVLNLIAATQDIATDGYAVDMLQPHERGLANGLQVAGYRVGMIVGGGALLMFYDQLGTAGVFAVMAALLALASLPVLVAREAPVPPATAPPAGGTARSAAHDTEAAAQTATHFLFRPGNLALIGLVGAYKAGDAFSTAMLRPFLADAGFDLTEIGKLLGTVGFAAGLVGALVGGALVNPLGRFRALLVFGVLQAVAVSVYALLAIGLPSLPMIYAACGVEHFAGGLATAALFTCMMDWSDSDTSATDYTVLASAVVIASGTAAAVAGFSAHYLGYQRHFWLGAVLTLAAVAVVYRLYPRGRTPVRLHAD